MHSNVCTRFKYSTTHCYVKLIADIVLICAQLKHIWFTSCVIKCVLCLRNLYNLIILSTIVTSYRYDYYIHVYGLNLSISKHYNTTQCYKNVMKISFQVELYSDLISLLCYG